MFIYNPILLGVGDDIFWSLNIPTTTFSNKLCLLPRIDSLICYTQFALMGKWALWGVGLSPSRLWQLFLLISRKHKGSTKKIQEQHVRFYASNNHCKVLR